MSKGTKACNHRPLLSHPFHRTQISFHKNLHDFISISRQLCLTSVCVCLHQSLALPLGEGALAHFSSCWQCTFRKAIKQVFSPLPPTRPPTARPPVSCYVYIPGSQDFLTIQDMMGLIKPESSKQLKTFVIAWHSAPLKYSEVWQ